MKHQLQSMANVSQGQDPDLSGKIPNGIAGWNGKVLSHHTIPRCNLVRSVTFCLARTTGPKNIAAAPEALKN